MLLPGIDHVYDTQAVLSYGIARILTEHGAGRGQWFTATATAVGKSLGETVMEPMLTEALVQALGGGRETPAWKSMGAVLKRLCAADTQVAEAWQRAGASGTRLDDVRVLAYAVARHADADEIFRERLQEWIAATLRGEASVDSSGTVEHSNVIHGASRVQGAVLQARDVAGGIHFHEAPPVNRVVPRQLLPVPAHFTDREQDIQALDCLRAKRNFKVPQVIVVSGPAGIGKTTLASRWLQEREAEFPDGQLYVDLYGFAVGEPPTPAEILGQLLRSLGQTELPATLADLTALWRSITAGLQFCLMLDNAMTAAQARLLLPNSPKSLVVVTSRNRLTGLATNGAAFRQLGRLDHHSAVELLSRGVGRERVDHERSAAHEVVVLCACLPLAVCLAAARLASRPERSMASLVDALTRGLGPLGALKVEGARTLQTVLDESYAALRDEAAAVYRRMGLLPIPVFDAAMVGASCGISDIRAAEVLDVLTEANLLEEIGADGYRFHDLVRLHAAQRGAEEMASAKSETLRRFVDWCLAAATSAEEILTPSHRNMGEREYVFQPTSPLAFSCGRQALDWLNGHREALMGSVRSAADAGWGVAVWQTVDAMWPMFLRLRLYDSWIEAHELGLHAARTVRDRRGEVRMLTSGGIGLRSAGRYEDAITWFSQALELARDEDNPREEAQALNGLGSSYRGAGRLYEARECFSRALSLREAIGYRRGAALSRLRLGELALDEGQYEKANHYLARALTDLVAEHDTYDATRARSLLGFALAREGRRDKGLYELRAALNDFEASGSDFWQARTLEMLGQVMEESSEASNAGDLYERARVIYESISPVDTKRVEGRLRALRPETPQGEP
ncbi:tetratricopeptide repeat protein [Streptomyces antimycoticus]|uniref:ATP-binding protein n=1 Tax=Streptomyces antimycoticus TaxID=68175 RepID=UPI00343212B0